MESGDTQGKQAARKALSRHDSGLDGYPPQMTDPESMRIRPRNLVQVHLPRSGLGHSLVSYARAYCYHAEGVAEFVHPNWFKIRIGPYLRREADKRDYFRIIRSPTGWGHPPWHGARKWLMRRVTEQEFDPAKSGQFLTVRDEGPDSPLTSGTMARLDPHRIEFAEALRSISRIAVRMPPRRSPTIGLFHRSGDMRFTGVDRCEDDRSLRTKRYGYLPPEFVAEALRSVRRIAGWTVPAVLSTDAGPEEISVIMAEGHVSLATAHSALANMLEMSQHDVLIVGTSMYARWAWFLSDAFAVTPKCESGHTVNMLEIPTRRSAWFVYEHENSLKSEGNDVEITRRLARP